MKFDPSHIVSGMAGGLIALLLVAATYAPTQWGDADDPTGVLWNRYIRLDGANRALVTGDHYYANADRIGSVTGEFGEFCQIKRLQFYPGLDVTDRDKLRSPDHDISVYAVDEQVALYLHEVDQEKRWVFVEPSLDTLFAFSSLGEKGLGHVD